jgi:hypothetical protein
VLHFSVNYVKIKKNGFLDSVQRFLARSQNYFEKQINSLQIGPKTIKPLAHIE